jgi:transaldolase
MDDFFPEDYPQPAEYPVHPGLQLYLDSADLRAWRRLLPLGFFYGVTTNPLLLERAGLPCTLAQLEEMTRVAVDLGAAEIHLQTWGTTREEMVHNGNQLALMAGLGIDVAVKVPATAEGWQVGRQLAETGCTITMTAVFSPAQVVLAAGFGAAFAAPYLGRIEDLARDQAGSPDADPSTGEQVILTMQDIVLRTQSPTRLLVASLRSAAQVVRLASLGLDTLTFSAKVADELLTQENTDRAAVDFQRAAENAGKNGGS